MKPYTSAAAVRMVRPQLPAPDRWAAEATTDFVDEVVGSEQCVTALNDLYRHVMAMMSRRKGQP